MLFTAVAAIPKRGPTTLTLIMFSPTKPVLHLRSGLCLLLAALALTPSARAQFGPRGPEVTSPEVSADHKIVFRIWADNAKSVKLSSSDLPGLFMGTNMTKGEKGVWEVTFGPVLPGSYRYDFNLDNVSVLDPANPATSEANSRSWSLVQVPGSEISDTKNVPHGSVAQVIYYSESLKRFRRLHVYTPPGYEASAEKYPIFYLLHGATDGDNSWSTVGRAGIILDNLLAEKKAKPMVMVMPHGHTGPFTFGGRSDLRMEEFVTDFNNDIKPLVEKRYRVYTDRAHRAMAGLSMGGAQTLDIAIPHLEDYAYFGVFSSGVLGITPQGPGLPSGATWESRNEKKLDDATLKNDLKLAWFATGKEDFMLKTTKTTMDVLKKHGFEVVYVESDGGHTWINWRNYLHTFAQKLFQ
jgi:enterochelin esterase-like enzyme